MKYFVDKTDNRNILLSNLFRDRQKQDVFLFGENDLEKIEEGDCIIFSPAKKFVDGYFLKFPNNIKIVCGNLSDVNIKILQDKNIEYHNLMLDEIFAIKNANLTAEGVLAIMLKESPRSMYKNNILILGGGRIALALSVVFSKLNLKFSIVSYNNVKFPKYYLIADKCFYKESYFDNLSDYDVVINTIPNTIIPDNMLDKFQNKCLFIETASVECLNKELVKNFTYFNAPALPSKFSVETAAELMYESIMGENKYED